MLRVLALLLAMVSTAAQASDCPRVDPDAQRREEAACRAGGGKWARFGVRDHLCGVYSCAPRTADGGKACRHRAECEFLCVAKDAGPVGKEVAGRCAEVRTSFGCTTHVDGGRIVGTVCVE